VNRLAALRRFCPAETLFFLGSWIVLLAVGRSRLFGDPGSLWHVVVGQRMLAAGTLLDTDPFSFTRPGEPWIPQSWLYECVLALLHRLDGLNMILLATVSLLAGLYTWIVHRLVRAGVHPLMAVLITLLAMLASAYHFHPRPHLLTIVFLGLTFALLCDFEAGRVSLRRLFWLWPLFAVWTNIHAGMLGGLGTLAVTVLGWVLAQLSRCWLDGPSLLPRDVLWLVLLVAGCGLTAFLNPYGTALPATWLALLRSPLLPVLIDEHGPLLQAGWVGSGVLLFGLLYVAALIGVLPRRPRVTWLLPLVWLALAFTRIRHGPLFAVTAVIALADMLPHVRWIAWLASKGSLVCRIELKTEIRNPKFEARARAALLPCVVLVAAIVVQAAGLSIPGIGRNWVRPDPRSCPLDLLPSLREVEGTELERTPIFNEMLFGGFLIYYAPGMRVFIDDRCELYGDDGLLEYALALRDDPSKVDRWARRYGFNMALTRAGSRFDTYLGESPDWTVIARTDTATLYRRKGHVSGER
jgi:hypothetical protein